MEIKMYFLILTILVGFGYCVESADVSTSHVFGGVYDNSSMRCLVLGDWGGLPDFPYRTFIENAVAAQMGKIADSINPAFILALGDNFYFDGVKDINDKRFNDTYENVFTHKSLMNIPWYIIAGNHDWHGNVSAQILYSKISKRWVFPNYYYNLQFGKENMLEIVMIDTIQLCGNVLDFGGLNLTSNFQPVASKKVMETQWVWIEEQLSMSKAKYLIVAGHYPVWSVAEHGPTDCLVERLLPMLYKYQVTAYLSGHDHNLQHLTYTKPSGKGNWTVEYMVTGAANFIDASLKHKNRVPNGSLKFHWADYLSLGGFGYLDVSPHNMNFIFTDSKGRVLHSIEMSPRSF